MTNKELVLHFSKAKQIDETALALNNAASRIHWKGLVGSARALFAQALAKQIPGHHLFVLNDKEAAAYFLNDLESLFPEDKNILFYPASYKVPYQFEDVDNANVVARAEVLDKINNGKNCWIISYPESLFERVPTQKNFTENTLKLEVGKIYSIDFVNDLLQEYNFERVDFVFEPGQYSIRGGIVDVFSFGNDHPFRVEFFGDEVETIRTFDCVSQFSLTNHTFFNLIPNFQQQVKETCNATILEFLGKNTTVWMGSNDIIEQTLSKEYEKAVKIYDQLNATVKFSIPSALYFHKTEWKLQLEQLSVIEWGPEFSFKATSTVLFDCQLQPSFNKNFELLKEDIAALNQTGVETLIFSNQPKQIERLYSIMEDIGSEHAFTPINMALHEGFISKSLKLACYTDHQIFERYHRFKLKEGFKQAKQALTLKEIYNLQKGDYVTHVDHGVGRFSGLEAIDVNGKTQEAIRLEYKDGDIMYVSIHSLHRISKFTGKDGSVPKMNKLGTTTWATLKQKTKKKIKEIAFDLIQLYAKRKSQPGFAYTPDTYLQTELEASFMYEDTPDQIKATQAIKEDMEKSTPMDRLICGDVGFGKTEIAIRAAFKAVADGKQVAVLVPTTILCHQHFRSFSARLEDFPCRVDYVNRFRSAKKVTEVLKDVEAGEVDILIGTSKLVGDKVKYKDLGLIIIDEEQKFGVAVKDKLKTVRATVDTLTLTATPIPRTLQFSLMGARDLSIINTPPPNRQPVLTEIVQLNEESIRDMISYELDRDGQVFFVHNKLANIKEVQGMIQRLCPDARVCVGHGQMEGHQLEEIMMDFIQHKYDVLVATTIIESGIDISNANTIIINDAQNFGLSDLHQLRGRVGRSNKKGFCYLIAPKFSGLTSEARKRLEALVQFSDLGAGFNIAMKDLDIRGAGNMLGGEQSGFIADIGFEMYQKILNEAIKELKEKEFKDLYDDRNTDDFSSYVEDCILETDLELRIPEVYINNVAERLSIYQAIDGLENEEALTKYALGLVDRFGPLPKVVEELIKSFRLRWMASSIGFEKIVIKNRTMIGYFIADPGSEYYGSAGFTKVLDYIKSNPQDCKMSEKNNKLRLLYGNVNTLDQALTRLNELC